MPNCSGFGKRKRFRAFIFSFEERSDDAVNTEIGTSTIDHPVFSYCLCTVKFASLCSVTAGPDCRVTASCALPSQSFWTSTILSGGWARCKKLQPEQVGHCYT